MLSYLVFFHPWELVVLFFNRIFIFYVFETRNGFRLLFTIRSPQLHAVGMGSLCLMTENAKLKITFKILSNWMLATSWFFWQEWWVLLEVYLTLNDKSSGEKLLCWVCGILFPCSSFNFLWFWYHCSILLCLRVCIKCHVSKIETF